MIKIYESFMRALNEEVQLKKLALYFDDSDSSTHNVVLYNPERLFSVLTSVQRPGMGSIYEQMIKKHGVIGYMQISSPQPDECMQAYEVVNSAVDEKYQGQGYGKLLYQIAMVKLYPDSLMSDRASVSGKAQNVWKSLEKNPEVEKLPPDKPPFKGEFDNIENPETEPREDDCLLHLSKPWLNKAYRLDDKKVLQIANKLINNHRVFIQKLDDEREKLYTPVVDFKRLGGYLFSTEYSGG